MSFRLASVAALVAGIWFWNGSWLGRVGLLSLMLWGLVWLFCGGERRRFSAKLVVLWFCLGLARAVWDGVTEPEPPWDNGKMIKVSGTVMESPRQWGRSQVFFVYVCRAEGVLLPDPALVLIRWSGPEDVVAIGESWEFYGRFELGQLPAYPGGYSQRFWLWTQRAVGVVRVTRFGQASYLGPPQGWGPRNLAGRLRLRMLERLERIGNGEARALVAGVVFGDTQSLPKEIQEQFRRTGTSHLLAASGMNVALLIGLCVGLASWFGIGPWRIAPALIPVAVGYAFLAGCAPSITRAAASAVVGLLAMWWGRTSNPWNCLAISVGVLVLWEPRQIYDLGFALSVLAVIGLLGGPKLQSPASAWKTSLLMTVSATLLTLPMIWKTFHQLSLTFLPANLILGPLVELLFPLGLVLTLMPLTPLIFATEKLALFCLFLVEELSWLADPLPLAEPSLCSFALLLGAITLWLGGGFKSRWAALPLSVLALLCGSYMASQPQTGPAELVIRRVGESKPYYWISSFEKETVYLSSPWQEDRARAFLLESGCLRPPVVLRLRQWEPLSLCWGAFSWKNVEPLLPKAPFIEVRTQGTSYRVRDWSPYDD